MSELFRGPVSSASKIIAAVTAAVLVSGCTVGPDYQKPEVPMPAVFTGALTDTMEGETTVAVQAGDQDLSAWWSAFNDPVLDALVERAVLQNLDLQVAQARVREARALRRITSADFLPTVDANGSYTRQRDSQSDRGGGPVGGTSGSSVERDLWQAGFDANWEIDVFGGTRRAVEAADATIEAQIARRNDVLLTLLSEVARNYVELRGSQQRLRIARQNSAAQRQTLSLIEARLNAGLASELDTARARAQVATTESAIPSFQTAVRASAHRLAVLLGSEPTALLEELSTQAPIPPVPPAVPVGLPGELLLRRPDIREAERLLAAETADIGVARSDLYPRFSLTGSFGSSSARFEDTFSSPSLFYTFGPRVSWPVFQGGRIRANIEVQTAQQQAALANFNQSILVALEDVENALVALNREQARRELLLQAVEANRRAVDLSNQLYERGLTTFLDVLQAQRDLFTTEDALVDSERAVSANFVALYKALGGGWQEVAPGVPDLTEPRITTRQVSASEAVGVPVESPADVNNVAPGN